MIIQPQITKEMKQLIFMLLLAIIATTTIDAQHSVFAGNIKYAAFGSQLQLNALPVDEGVWDTVQGFTESNIFDICYANDTTVFAVGQNGNLFKSIDGGKTWTSKIINHPTSLGRIAFYDHLNGVACASNSTIVITDDGGETWKKTFDSGSFRFAKIKYLSKNTILITESSNIVISYDGGITWSVNPNPNLFKMGLSDFFESSGGNIFALFTTGKIAMVNNYTVDTIGVYSTAPNLRSAVFVEKNMAVVVSNNIIGHLHYDEHMNFIAGYVPLNIDSVYEEIKQGNGTIKKINGVKLSSLSLYSVKFVTNKTGYIIGNLSANSDSYILKTDDGGFNWKIDKMFKNKQINDLDVYNSNVIVSGSNFIARFTTESTNADIYSWSPTVGLSNPNIKNPVATVSQPIEYTVTRTHGANISTSKVYIEVEALKIISAAGNAIGCTGSVPLEYVRTNYCGATSLTYKWVPATGLSADNIPNPIFTDNQIVNYKTDSASYTLTVTAPNGEFATKEVTVARKPLIIFPLAKRTFICGYSSLGNRLGPVYTNYTGTQPLSYRWFSGSQVLANEPNPIMPIPTKTTTYTLEVSTAEGCFQKTTVIVTINTPTVNTGADKTIGCGESIKVDYPIINFTQSGKISYKWTPATGLSSDTIAQPIASPNVTTTYTLTVTSTAGCSATDAVIVNVNPFTVNAGDNVYSICSADTQLGPISTNYMGTGKLRYKWTPATGLESDTVANPVVNIKTTTEYTLTVTNENGCLATDKAKVIINSPDKPKIDFVSVTSAAKNAINWSYTGKPVIKTYRIYRETNVANTYEKIAELDNTVNYFVDTLSFPYVQSNSYKLAVVDVCDNESPQSDKHKTMHLSINQGINGTWNLIWEQYSGFVVSTYNIFRGTTQTDIRQIGSLSGNNTQFTDFTAPAGFVYYQIEAVSSWQTGVSASGKMAVSQNEKGVAFTSRSNLATNKSDVDGIFQLKDVSSELRVYPNPASDKFNLVLNLPLAQETTLKIFDVTGMQILSKQITSNNQSVNTNHLSNGVYLIFVESDLFTAKQKLVINRK